MALNSRKKEAFVWDGNWDSLPPVLTSRHLAAIKGVTVETIWDHLQAKTMRPKPDFWSRPYRWQKARVMAALAAVAA